MIIVRHCLITKPGQVSKLAAKLREPFLEKMMGYTDLYREPIDAIRRGAGGYVVAESRYPEHRCCAFWNTETGTMSILIGSLLCGASDFQLLDAVLKLGVGRSWPLHERLSLPPPFNDMIDHVPGTRPLTQSVPVGACLHSPRPGDIKNKQPEEDPTC